MLFLIGTAAKVSSGPKTVIFSSCTRAASSAMLHIACGASRAQEEKISRFRYGIYFRGGSIYENPAQKVAPLGRT